MTGDSLKQPNFGPGFGVQVAAFDMNLFAVNATHCQALLHGASGCHVSRRGIFLLNVTLLAQNKTNPAAHHR
jgi:hypothetical protein